jgi:hypothetical protein
MPGRLVSIPPDRLSPTPSFADGPAAGLGALCRSVAAALPTLKLVTGGVALVPRASCLAPSGGAGLAAQF